jgi:putative ABC transport system ATP-binding protein
MIEIVQLEFSYAASGFRLRIPRLSIQRGERVAVFGPSGCGKTTLLGLVAGLLVPRQGSVHVDDTEVSALGDAHRRRFRIARIGLVFQQLELIESLPVLENILLPYRINGSLALTPEVHERARCLATELGLGELLRRLPARLSQGEQQRVAIARALVTHPALLLADEPTANLDPARKQSVCALLCEQARQARATLLLITHDRSLLPHFDRALDFQDLTPGDAP